MDDASRIIGELKEFKRATIDRLDLIEIEIRTLNQFKWRVAGVFSFLLVAVEVVRTLTGK